jgi:adenylate kinase
METRTIFFIGKPGCGKGTQAKLLSEKTNWPVFGSGEEFRKIAEESTHVGKKVKQEIDAGLLSPPWFAMYLYQKALFSITEEQSVIFDGFNRKVPEAELIIDSLRWLERPFQVVNVVISDEEATKRIALRKLESDRVDDQFVPERLKEYNKFTKDALEIFRKARALIEVDGERSREAIAENLLEVLNLK